MISQIKIVEKPDWVTWKDISQCLYEAHSVNRVNGIKMTKYLLPPDKICEYIGANGVMIVALNGETVIGTAALCERYGKKWYAKGRYANLSFGSVLPEYKGQGIYQKLNRMRENIIVSRKYPVILGDTHKKNKRLIKIAKLNGYRLVDCTYSNVFFAKWTGKCPYSKLYCRYRFCISWIWANIRAVLSVVKHRIIKPILKICRERL